MIQMTIEQIAKKTQKQRILDLLKAQGSATNRELNSICYRYAARIHELRKEGHDIQQDIISRGLRVFIYRGEK